MGGLETGLSDREEHHGWKPSTDKWFSTVVWKADIVVDPSGCCLGYGICSLNIRAKFICCVTKCFKMKMKMRSREQIGMAIRSRSDNLTAPDPTAISQPKRRRLNDGTSTKQEGVTTLIDGQDEWFEKHVLAVKQIAAANKPVLTLQNCRVANANVLATTSDELVETFDQEAIPANGRSLLSHDVPRQFWDEPRNKYRAEKLKSKASSTVGTSDSFKEYNKSLMGASIANVHAQHEVFEFKHEQDNEDGSDSGLSHGKRSDKFLATRGYGAFFPVHVDLGDEDVVVMV